MRTVDWDAAVGKGLAMADRPFYQVLGLKVNPFSLTPLSDPHRLVGADPVLSNLLTILAREGSRNLAIISAVSVRGGGATSVLQSLDTLVTRAKRSGKADVADFARKLTLCRVSARKFLEPEEPEGEAEGLSSWVDTIQSVNPTHVLVDDCDAVGRHSVLPYINAILDRLGRPLVFVLAHTPSSQNRFLSDISRVRHAAEWLRGTVYVPPLSLEEFHKVLRLRTRRVDSWLSRDSIGAVWGRTHGSIKEALRLAQLCIEEGLATDRFPVSSDVVDLVADRVGDIDMTSTAHRLTEEQSTVLQSIIDLGDHVTADELAEELGVVRTAAVRMLLRIETKGWLLSLPLGNRTVYELTSNAKGFLEASIILDQVGNGGAGRT